MGTDARTRYTKQAIRSAFFSLLESRPIEKITVKQICESAQINRATFYRYYDNQYDLLSMIENEMLDDIRETIQMKTDIDDLTRQTFRLLYQNNYEWRLLTGKNADSRFQTKIYSIFGQYFMEEDFSDYRKMKYRFMLYGFSGLFDYWVKGGMKESPEKMAEYLISLRHDLLDRARPSGS